MIDHLNSPDVFLIVGFIGMLLCAVSAVITKPCGDRLLDRINFGIYVTLSFAIGASLCYSYYSGWTPWPPDLIFLALFDALLIVRILKRAKLLRMTEEARGHYGMG